MAVTFKTDENYGYSVLKLFQVPQDVIDNAKAHSLIMDMSGPGSFVVKANDGSSMTVVPIKAQAISLAKAGSMGPASLSSIKFQLIGAIHTALGMPYKEEPVTAFPSKLTLGKAPTLQSVLKKTGAHPDILAAMTKKSQGMTNNDMHNTVPVQPKELSEAVKLAPTTLIGNLIDADQVYAPVHGTSQGAVYYVVARLKGLNVAIRSKSTSLSVRVEGVAQDKYKDALIELGFSVKSAYASVHFECVGNDLMTKTVGAIIGRLGMNNLIQGSDISQVLGKS